MSFSSSPPSPLSAPPLISSSAVRITIPSSTSVPPLLDPSLVTPAACDPEMYYEGAEEESSTGGDDEDVVNANTNNNICGDKEKVGRWTEQEHQVFLQGLHTHGKQWKTIAGMIGTRTVVQVRTHAQKYFQKMERSNGGAVEFVVRPKVKQQQPASGGRSPAKRKSLPSSLPSRKKSRKASTRLSMGTRAASTTQLETAITKSNDFVYQGSLPEVL